MIPLRQNRTVLPELKKIGPLADDHPVTRLMCPGCSQGLEPGEYITLIPIGPGPYRNDQERARAGGWFSGGSVAVHWTCATGEES